MRITTKGWCALALIPFAFGFFSIPLGIWWN